MFRLHFSLSPSLQGKRSVETLPRQRIHFTVIMFADEYKIWSSSLCSFLQSAANSSLFGPNFNKFSICIKDLSYQRTEHVEGLCCQENLFSLQAFSGTQEKQ
jgi:hypothetical protein